MLCHYSELSSRIPYRSQHVQRIVGCCAHGTYPSVGLLRGCGLLFNYAPDGEGVIKLYLLTYLLTSWCIASGGPARLHIILLYVYGCLVEHIPGRYAIFDLRCDCFYISKRVTSETSANLVPSTTISKMCVGCDVGLRRSRPIVV